MQNGLSTSVKVFSLDRRKAIETIRKAIRAVQQRCPEVDRAILVGSLARGDAVPGSDADVLLVLRDTALPFRDRLPRYLPRGVGMSVDVFAYTRAELEGMRESSNPFLARALREGMDLF